MQKPLEVDARVKQATFGLLQGQGRGYIGEPVSQLEHALQCADLARRAHAATEEILAALLHDIGHLIAPADAAEMDGLGVVNHEGIGAEFLHGLGFAPRVCALVGSHVEAKRYLACQKPGYLARLSDASRGTLAFQGGPMSAAEAARFEADPLFAAKVRLRSWDEAAKEPDRPTASIEFFTGMIREHLEQRR